MILISFTAVTGFSLPPHTIAYSESITSSIINCEFDEAFRMSDSLINEYPGDPLPLLLKLVTIGMRDVDFEKTIDSAGFLKAYNDAMTAVKAYEQQHGISSYSRTLEGFCKVTHSSFYLRSKSYVAALQNGLDGIRLLKDAKELDPSNTEVNFFLGMYDFAKAELRSRLWWVLFWYPGDKKEGIKLLNECSKTAKLTSTAALLSLSDIYVQEGKPERSASIIEHLEKEYPESRFVLWAKAKYLEKIKNYTDAAIVYERLSLSYASCTEGMHNALVTRNRVAHMLKASGQHNEAAKVCRLLLEEQAINNNRELKKDTERLLGRSHGKN